MKTPVMQASTRPLLDIEKAWRSEYAAQLKAHNQEIADWETLDASKRGEKPRKPIARRLVVNDSTFEKIHALMCENPSGLLVICDELTGWCAQLDRAGREGAFYLSSWDGNTAHNLDRISRGSIRVEACCLSMSGGIQPARLRAYLGAGGMSITDDGMIQRFQALVWPDVRKDFEHVDRAPNTDAREQYARILQSLVALEEGDLPPYRFDLKAQDLFEAWFEEHEKRIRSGRLSLLMTGHLAKYKSLFPSLALLFELADRAALYSKTTGLVLGGFGGFSAPAHLTVSYENVLRAFRWMSYLESHAARMAARAS
jgi:hypothetical protein